MSTHTPGPWRLIPHAHGGAVLVRGEKAMFERHMQSHLHIVPIEDARLIAAAPDLLEAVKVAFDWLGGVDGAVNIRERLLAAIAKAEGRS